MFIKPKICILIIVLLSLPFLLSAQKGFSYKLGGNYSRFRNVDTQMKPGIAFGLGYEWQIKKNGGFAIDVSYINRKGLLKNKSIGSGTGFDWGEVFYDINCSIEFIESQLQFLYYLPINNDFKIKFSLGPSLTIAYHDRSKISFLSRKVLEGDDRYDHHFHYTIDDDPGPFYIGHSSGFGYNWGFGIVWAFLSLEYRYQYSLYEIRTIATDISLREKMDTMYLIVGFSLDELLSINY